MKKKSEIEIEEEDVWVFGKPQQIHSPCEALEMWQFDKWKPLGSCFPSPCRKWNMDDQELSMKDTADQMCVHGDINRIIAENIRP